MSITANATRRLYPCRSRSLHLVDRIGNFEHRWHFCFVLQVATDTSVARGALVSIVLFHLLVAIIWHTWSQWTSFIFIDAWTRKLLFYLNCSFALPLLSNGWQHHDPPVIPSRIQARAYSICGRGYVSQSKWWTFIEIGSKATSKSLVSFLTSFSIFQTMWRIFYSRHNAKLLLTGELYLIVVK